MNGAHFAGHAMSQACWSPRIFFEQHVGLSVATDASLESNGTNCMHNFNYPGHRTGRVPGRGVGARAMAQAQGLGLDQAAAILRGLAASSLRPPKVSSVM
jgi:hypothetical protein